jgi:acetyl-CoA carboxylase alpha subunit
VKLEDNAVRRLVVLLDGSRDHAAILRDLQDQAESGQQSSPLLSSDLERNLREMARLTVPIVTVVIGEGGSGGALAIAVADVVIMFENSIYSVISPEGCASILWRDQAKISDAAEQLKLSRHALRYRMQRLNITTSTEDVDGATLATTACDHVTRAALEAEMQKWLGDVQQTPPMVSAVKKDGVLTPLNL